MDDMDAESEELGGKRKFFSGEFARYGWKKLLAPDLGGFDVLTLYAEAIQKMNINKNIPQLFRDIFKNAYLPYRDPETLKSFLKIIDDFEYDHSERLGDAFEYLLSVLGSQGDAGQFRTPRHIIDFMVELVDPKKNETILDPACGTAGFLISSYKHIVKNNSSLYNPDQNNTIGNGKGYSGDKLTPDERKKLAVNIRGYDISPDMVRLSLVNLYLHGFTNPLIVEYDTLTSEEKWNEFSDIIMANPPFMSPKGGIKPHKRFSVESSRSEVLFVDYIAEHLTPNGRAAVIVPEGIIFQSGTAYKSLRKMLVEKYLYAVVSLPSGVFNPYTAVKTSILLMDKVLARKTDKILFAKIDNDGFDLGAQRKANNKGEILYILNTIKEYVKSIHNGSVFIPDNYNNFILATKENIAEKDDWNLSASRYEIIEQNKDNSYHYVKLSSLLEKSGTKIGKAVDAPIMSITMQNGLIDQSDKFKKRIASNDISSYKAVMFNELVVGFPIDEGVLGFQTKYPIAAVSPAYDIWKIKTTNCDVLYLEMIFRSSHARILYRSKMRGTANRRRTLSKDVFLDLMMPIPPLDIQKEIVAEIVGWQKIIDGARMVVENYKPQIQIDPSWQQVELRKVLARVSNNIEPKSMQGDVCYIGLENISQNTGALVNNRLTNYQEIKSTKNIFRPGNLLYGKLRPNLNKVWLATMDGICSTDIIVLNKVDPKTDMRFYSDYLRSDKFNYEVIRGLKGAQLPRVGWDYFSSINIPFPPFEMQNHIADNLQKEQEMVSSSNRLISLFEQKIKDKIASVWGE